jgi:DNA polymerase III epsilon subunit-like protein
MKILIFDTETNGLYRNNRSISKQPHILQLSWLVINHDDNIINSHSMENYYVKIGDDVDIPESATNVHGITKDFLKRSKLSMDIKTLLSKFLLDCQNADKLVAHNIEFDINMIKTEIERNNISMLFKHDNIYCTMMNNIKLCNIEKINKYGSYLKYPKLSELYEKLYPNDEQPNFHDSLTDVICTCRCFFNIVYQIDILDYLD